MANIPESPKKLEVFPEERNFRGMNSTRLLNAFFAASWTAPLALSMAVCSGAGIIPALITVLICPFLFLKYDLRLSYSAFVIVMLAGFAGGVTASGIAVLTAGLLLFAFSFFDKEKLHSMRRFAYAPAVGAVMLGLALTMTVMQTTNYFGIGAVGNNVFEMLASYRSLGFHGNWRGVLYGTITLVIMITYPRKFKKLSQSIPAPFWSILFTTLLNLWLNPSAETTAINEVGSGLLSTRQAFILEAFSGAFPDAHGIITAIVSGLALFFILFYLGIRYDNTRSTAYWRSLGIVSAIGSLFGLFPAGGGKSEEKNSEACVFSGIFAAILSTLIIVVYRIPVHTLAVILIVGMWQQVDWHSLKLAFTGGVKSIAVFVVIIAAFFFLGAAVGTVLGAVLSIFINKSKPSRD